jgi:hypothetical protein
LRLRVVARKIKFIAGFQKPLHPPRLCVKKIVAPLRRCVKQKTAIYKTVNGGKTLNEKHCEFSLCIGHSHYQQINNQSYLFIILFSHMLLFISHF